MIHFLLQEESLSKTDESLVEEKASGSPIWTDVNDLKSKILVSPEKESVKIKSKFFGRCLSHDSVFAIYDDLSPTSSLTKSKSEEKVFLNFNKDHESKILNPLIKQYFLSYDFKISHFDILYFCVCIFVCTGVSDFTK